MFALKMLFMKALTLYKVNRVRIVTKLPGYDFS